MPTRPDRRPERALLPTAKWHSRPARLDRRTRTAPPIAPPSPPLPPFPPRPENGSGSNPANWLQPADLRQFAAQTSRPLSAARPGSDAALHPQTAAWLAKEPVGRARIAGQWGLAPACRWTDARLTSRLHSRSRTAKSDGAAFVECLARIGTSRLPQPPGRRHHPGTDCFPTIMSSLPLGCRKGAMPANPAKATSDQDVVAPCDTGQLRRGWASGMAPHLHRRHEANTA